MLYTSDDISITESEENMSMKIALAGNPNCGKTTLFNVLTGSNQFVGNWPGVTVEKKEGKLKQYEGVVITDLPGIYSLSPYTLEEVVARNYLIEERPDVILNVIDGTNLERNLYLTTQLTEIGIPVVVAINMMDVLRKNGDILNIEALSKAIGCRVVEISALKGEGITEAVEAAMAAVNTSAVKPQHSFSGPVEHALAHIEEAALHNLSEEQQRWYSIKIFERDEKVLQKLGIPSTILKHIENDIKLVEAELDDDAESIITNERYNYITSITAKCFKRKNADGLSTSDKIDKIVTNRILGLPIFALIMVLVYYISVTSVGKLATDWANDGLFGDGFHLFGMSGSYEEELDSWAENNVFTDKVENVIDAAAENDEIKGAAEIQAAFEAADFGAFEEAYGSYKDEFYKFAEYDDEGNLLNSDAVNVYDIDSALGAALDEEGGFTSPDPARYGTWVPGVPVLVENGLDKIGCAEWLKGLILDGIVGGVGAVLGFVPQMLVLFLFLAFLEACGYMSRVAFIMDRLFRRFGLSGKSFIPILIGTGCGVPGIMASRTIENVSDRRMTIMTTTFIPCGAKLPIIAMISTALFGGAWWVGPSAYFMGMAAIIISGIILKKTKLFAGDTAPFVMELPAYHMPTFVNLLRSMWERGWSFIKKAGTVILLSSIIIWAGSVFGWADGGAFGFYPDMELSDSILGKIGEAIKWIFIPLGFNNAAAAVATIMGFIAKEEVVGVFGVLDFEGFSKLAGYSFLAFNLLCAPCFAAVGAMKREFNNAKWTCFAVLYQCAFAYIVSLCIYQIGNALTGNMNALGLAAAIAAIILAVYMLVRPDKSKSQATVKK